MQIGIVLISLIYCLTITQSDNLEINIKLSKEIYEKGEIIEGEIVSNFNLMEEAVEIEWFDSYNRLIKKQIKKDTKFAFKIDETFTMVNRIEAKIYKGGKVIASTYKEFDIALERSNWDDYELVFWTWYGDDKDPKDSKTLKFYELIQGLGGNAMVMRGHPFRHLINTNTRFFVTQMLFPYFYLRYACMGKLDPEHLRWGKGLEEIPAINLKRIREYQETKDKMNLKRYPCLNEPILQMKDVNFSSKIKQDENANVTAKEILSFIIEKVKFYHPLFYITADEPSLTSFIWPTDFCFCQYCLEKFREYLKREYKNLKKLNKQWGTNFKNWIEVIPSTFEEVKTRKDRNFSSWADHRTFMDITFVQSLQMLKNWCKELDPLTPVGIEGAQRPSCYGGYDYWRLMQVLEICENYNVGNEKEIIRSFMDKDFRMMKIMNVSDRDGKHNLWNQLFHGQKINSVWLSGEHINKEKMVYTDTAEYFKEAYKEIKKGVAKLLIRAERIDYPIAIHYSQASIQAAYIFYGEPLDENETSFMDRNRIAIEKIIEDLGLQYKYVSYEQIEKGELIKKGYKVLILPLSIALSYKEVIAIKNFIEQGGLLIADRMTGIMDNHCKLLNKGQLDEVFGIKRTIVDVSSLGINIKEDKKLGLERLNIPLASLNSKIRITSGKALGEWSGQSCFVINKYGKGNTLYLNFDISDYLTWRSFSSSYKAEESCYLPLRAEKIQEIFKKILKQQGINSEIKITRKDDYKPLYATEIFRFEDKNLQYVGIIRNPSHRRSIEKEGFREENVIIEFNKKTYIYEIRKNEYFGLTDKIEQKFNPYEAMLFALLPYEIKGIELKIEEQQQKKIFYTINILKDTDTDISIGNHVVRVEVFNPKGNYIPYYSKNLMLIDGQARSYIAFALNDEIGEWKIIAKEAISGKQVEQKIMIK